MLQWLGANHRTRGQWLVWSAVRIKTFIAPRDGWSSLDMIRNKRGRSGLTSRTIYYVGMFGGFALAAVVLTYKPDTR